MSCLICNEDLSTEETTKVGWRGLKTLVKFSIIRKDNLAKIFEKLDSITLHSRCWKRYTRGKINAKGEFRPGSIKPKETNRVPKETYEYIPISNTISSNNLTTITNTHKVEITPKSIINNVPITSENTLHLTEYLPESNDTSTVPIYGTSSNQIDTSSTSQSKYVTVPAENSMFESKSRSSLPTDLYSMADDLDPTKPFPFQHRCVFCKKDIGKEFIKKETKKRMRSRNEVHRFKSNNSKETIIRHLLKRSTPEDIDILNRIKDVDLVEVGAGYHKRCYRIALLHEVKPDGLKGRQDSASMKAAMTIICRYIEEGLRTSFTASELQNLLTNEEDKPVWRTIRSKLLKRYPNRIFFNTTPGKRTVVTLIRDVDGAVQGKPSNSEVQQSAENVIVQKKQENSVPKKPAKKTNTINLQIKKKKEIKVPKKQAKEKSPKHSESNTMDEIPQESNICDDDDDDALSDPFESIFTEFAGETETLEQEVDKSGIVLSCRICLSTDRRLDELGEYIDVYRSICANIIDQDLDSKLVLLCWECKALLKNVKRFQEKIRTAQKLWNTNIEERKCLSTLCIIFPSSSANSEDENYHAETYQEQIEIKIEKEQFDAETDDFNPSSDVKTEEINYMECDNDDMYRDNDDSYRDNDSDDEEDENDEMDTVRSKRKRSLKKTNKKANIKDENCSENDEDSSSSENSDPDWEMSDTNHTQTSKNTTKPPKISIPYAVIVQDYDAQTKISRVPIQPNEVHHWREKERNSVFFQTLEQKCLSCITKMSENHNKECHAENPFVCDICKSTFSSKEQSDTHTASHYYIYSCDICDYKCCDDHHMLDHVERHRRLVQCIECHAAKETLELLKHHYNELHRHCDCDYCGRRFNHKLHLETHIQRHHVPHICTVCKKVLKTYSLKQRHMKMRHVVDRTEAAYCVQCDKQFNNVALFNHHVKYSAKHKHEWECTKKNTKKAEKEVKKEYKCPECPNVYSSQYILKGHYNLVHANKINFSCNLCDKAFPHRSGYKRHVKYTHEGFVPPKNKFCHICGRGFSTNKILMNHIRTHTGEKPYACAHCPAAFAQKVALRSHAKRHARPTTAPRPPHDRATPAPRPS